MTHPENRFSTTIPAGSPRAVRDEWGIYDPEQAGLEAVLRRVTAKRTGAAAPAAPSAAAPK